MAAETTVAREGKAAPINSVSGKSLQDLEDQMNRIDNLYLGLQQRDTSRALRLMRNGSTYDRGQEIADGTRERQERRSRAVSIYERYANNARTYALRNGQLGNRSISGPTGRIRVPRNIYTR